MSDLWPELTALFQTVFDNPGIVLDEKTTASDIAGWDSFSHMNLIAAIEERFKIEFSQSEALNFQNVGELAETVQKKMGK